MLDDLTQSKYVCGCLDLSLPHSPTHALTLVFGRSPSIYIEGMQKEAMLVKKQMKMLIASAFGMQKCTTGHTLLPAGATCRRMLSCYIVNPSNQRGIRRPSLGKEEGPAEAGRCFRRLQGCAYHLIESARLVAPAKWKRRARRDVG